MIGGGRISRHRAAIYSMISLGLRLLTAPLCILLIANKLSIEEQALYYTFIAIGAIQFVFELGMNTCMVQKLSSLKDRVIEYISFGYIYILTAMILLFISLQIYYTWVVGELSFEWLLYSLFLSINLLMNFILAIREGCGAINHVYKTKLRSSVAYSLVLILSLFLGAELYSLSLAQFAILTSIVLSLYFDGFKVEFKILRLKTIKFIFKDIISFQYKLSLVWFFGYFYWNAYSVYFYKYIGVNEAAQYGATNAVFGAIAIGMASWLQTKRASLGRLVSDGEISKTIYIAIHSSILSIIGYLIISSVFVVALHYKIFSEFSDRFMPMELLYFIMAIRFSILIQELILVYLRVYNDEPLYLFSLTNYMLTPFIIYYCHSYNDIKLTLAISFIVQVIFVFIMTLKSINYITCKVKSERKNLKGTV